MIKDDCVLLQGDCLETLKTLPDNSIDCCVTSPPYWGLRDYGVEGQLGLEKTPEAYVAKMIEVFREVRRVLRDDGTLWLNLGDSYNAGRNGGHPGGGKQGHRECYAPRSGGNVPGLKPKDLVGIPWRVAFALQADGWYLRQDIIWAKPNAMPESVTDRCTKSHEYVFLLSKSNKYYFDSKAIQEPALDTKSIGRRTSKNGLGSGELGSSHRFGGGEFRNKRSVWTVTTKPFKGAHFATFPPDLIEPCVLAGCPPNGIVLDPFNGAGTTGLVSLNNGRKYLGIELNPEYVKITEDRLAKSLEIVS